MIKTKRTTKRKKTEPAEPARSVLLLEWPSGSFRPGAVVVSLGFERAAAIVDDEAGRARVATSDGLGPARESVRCLKISSDGQGVAYAFRRAGADWACVNGEEHGPFEDLQSDFYFSPDSKTASWVATVDGEWRVHESGRIVRSGPDDAAAARDGYPDPSFAELDAPAARPFKACALTQQAAHSADAEVESGDGARLVKFYLNKLKGLWIVEEGGKEREFEAISRPAFSDDGAQLIYWARPRTAGPAVEFLLRNHEPMLEAEAIAFNDPSHYFCFDASGERVLSRFRDEAGWHLLLGDSATPGADWVSDPYALFPTAAAGGVAALAVRGAKLSVEHYPRT